MFTDQFFVVFPAGKAYGSIYTMHKDMFFDFFGEDCFAAVTENGKLVEFHLDADSGTEISGNIYKGRVVNVLEGMQAAFVSFGQEKNGYLYAGDIPVESVAAGCEPPPRLNVRVGEEVMVQVSKSPIGTKGARLSMCLSFVGKNLIYLPSADFCAVSRKIEREEDRARLTALGQKLLRGDGGFVMRTKARHADLAALEEEAAYLRGLYLSACEAYAAASVGDIVYRDADVHARLLRDFDLSDVANIYIGDEEAYRRVEEVFRRAGRKGNLVRYAGEREMFDFYRIEEQVYRLIGHRVDLENGAYLIFDRTEALTAIDVNTGRYIGATELEETVFETNLLAAREIARQVRMRNIGGIVVVDFIDMVDPLHRAAVAAELDRCLHEDRAKCNVGPMSELGLIQFTRKKFKSDNVAMLTKKCPHCNGSGTVLSDSYIAFRIQIAVKRCFAEGYESAIVELNAGVFSYILTTRRFTHLVRGEWKGKRIYLIPHKTYHEERFTVRGDNDPVLTLPYNAQLLY